MSHVFLYALSASVLASIGGLVGAVFLVVKESFAKKLSRVMLSFAAGVLLGVTFLDLMPEALKSYDGSDRVFTFVFLGVVIFYLIERAVASFHRHEHQAIDEHAETSDEALKRSVPLIIFGDSLHNFIDGITVAVTFVVSVPLGIATATSVFVHEIPHEIADFTILLRTGMRRSRVFLVNLVAALVSPLGTVVAYFFASHIHAIQAPLLAFAAGNLLYISMTDLLPHLHHERDRGTVLVQTLLFVLGVAIFFFVPKG